MKICFVNYCYSRHPGTNTIWEGRRALQVEDAKRHGATEIRSWNETLLHGTVFYQLHQEAFEDLRYAGLAMWRPYIIFQTLLDTKCDVVMYLDCDLRIVNSLENFTKYVIEQDVVAVGSPWLNGQFTRREVLIRMDVDTPEYYNLQQLYGGLLAFKKSELSLKFLFDWHTIATEEGMFALDRDRLAPEHPGFYEPREQGCLTILYHQYGFKQYPLNMIDITNLQELGGATLVGYVVEKME